MSKYHKELKLAIDLVKNAVEITEWFRSKGYKSYIKDDQSPVTLADFASQIYILSVLKSQFSNDKIIAEEENLNLIDESAENFIKQCFNELDFNNKNNIYELIGYRGSSSVRQWTVDPIDGTIGFQKGLSYAVGVGFMVNSTPKVCAIAIPNYAGKSLAIFSAEHGYGAHVSYDGYNFEPIKVSQKKNLRDICLCLSLHYNKPWVTKFAREIGISNFIQIDSMAKFAMVADGSADLYIKPLDEEYSFTWDFLPGDLIVREAGGQVSDLIGTPIKFKGKKCMWNKPGIISSNGLIHEKIIKKIAEQLSTLSK